VEALDEVKVEALDEMELVVLDKVEVGPCCSYVGSRPDQRVGDPPN